MTPAAGRPSTARVVLALVGVATAAYGGLRLLEAGGDDLLATAVWLAGGVVLHDAVLAPATLAVCALGAAVLPTWARGPAVAGLLVLGTLTLVAVPVLVRAGARADNPTLLDRDYGTGWLVVAGTVALVVGGWATAARWRASRAEGR